MALTKISTAMISQSAAAVDLNVDAGTFYVDTTNNRVGVGGKTDPDTPLHVIGTATATTFAGSGASLTSIPNSALVNSSITINSTAVSLGGSLTLTTANIAENTNLYYTNARADARIAAADTDDLSEGSSNLYYTDARVDARVSGGSLGNITTTGYIRGPATFTIDPAAHGDNTGTVVIAGNLQVDGVTTTINSTTLTVDDKNITLASGSANAAAASGAGFTVDIGTGTNPAITYDGTNDEWDFNKPLNVTGNIAVSGTVDGVDIAARDAVLTSTTTTAGAALPKAGGTMTGNLAINNGSPELHFGTTGNHYNWRLAAQETINAGFEIGVGSQDTDYSNDTYVPKLVILSGGNVGIGTDTPTTPLEVHGGGSMTGGWGRTATLADNFPVLVFQSKYSTDAFAGIGYDNSTGMKFWVNSSTSDLTGNSQEPALTILDNKNIGIGNQNPQTNLTIGSAQGNSLEFTYDSSNGYRNIISNHWDSSTDTRMDFNIGRTGNVAPVPVMSVGYGGNVGIGTTSPNSLLELRKTTGGYTTSGTGNKGAVLTLHHEAQWESAYGSGGSTPDWLGAIDFSTGDGSTGEGIRASIRTTVNNYYNTNDLAFYTANQGDATLDERMRITHGGNVGIGTTAPKRPLQIGATGSFPISFNGNYPDIHFNTYYDSGWRIHTAGFGAKTTFNGATGAFGFSNVASTQGANATFTPLERLTILASGNVGIGNTNPRTMLNFGFDHYTPLVSDNPDRILNWYDSNSELHNSKIYISAVSNSVETSHPQHIGLALANKNTTNNNWSPAITFGGLSKNGNFMNGGAAIASQNYTGTNDANFIGSDLHFFTKDSATSAGRNLTSKMVIGGNGNVGIGIDTPAWPLDVSATSSSVQLQLGRTGSNAGTAWLGADAGGFHIGVGAYGSGNSVGTPNGLEVRTDGAIYMGDRAANVPQINIGTQGKASGMEFYPYASVGTTYSAWDLNLGANISPKLGTTSSGHQLMTSYTASGGSNLRVGFNQLAWQRWTPAELNGKAAHDSVADKDGDPMFQVTTDGHMRAPYSSAFRTYLSTERTTNGVINSGWTDSSSSGVNAYDRAGDFNTSNGRFTAPVDGVYHFDVMWDSNGSQGGISLHVTGTGHTEYNVRWEPTGRSDNSWESRAYATSVQMDTGDYVELYAVHCTGTNPIHMGGGHWGFFAGHLVS
jgi:hypothetical protein